MPGVVLPTRPVRTRAREPVANMTPPKRLSVDPVACTGHGVCADMLPELIDLDDCGYPRIDRGAVPDQLLRSARRAVTACPALALRLRSAEP